MPFNINEFKTNGLTLGGARPSLFQVNLSLPDALFASSFNASNKFTFTCRASSIPASSVASFDVPYFGRKIKLAGDRTFADWNVTIMNDEDFTVRQMFEAWSSLINEHESNIKQVAANSYKTADAVVRQFSKKGDILNNSQYTFIGMFPTEISAMDLDWDATNAVQTFNVTFAYDYWVVGDRSSRPARVPPVTPPTGQTFPG